MPQPLLHPLLGKDPDFDLARYQPAIEATFRADTLPH